MFRELKRLTNKGMKERVWINMDLVESITPEPEITTNGIGRRVTKERYRLHFAASGCVVVVNSLDEILTGAGADSDDEPDFPEDEAED